MHRLGRPYPQCPRISTHSACTRPEQMIGKLPKFIACHVTLPTLLKLRWSTYFTYCTLSALPFFQTQDPSCRLEDSPGCLSPLGPKMLLYPFYTDYMNSFPLSRLARCISFGCIVTRFACTAHRLLPVSLFSQAGT